MANDPWQSLIAALPEHRSPKKKKKRRTPCGECGELMHLKGSMYVCPRPNCRGKCMALPDGRPAGIPADKETAKARRRAHLVFDHLWKSGRISRDRAYIILKRIMGLSSEEAHIGRFNKLQCEQLITTLNQLGNKVFEPPYNADGFLTKGET